MIYKILNRLIIELFGFMLKPFFGKKQYQPIFTFIHKKSLHGMNYGISDMNTNGELLVFDYLQKKYDRINNLVIFDVGANIGEYSTQIIRSFKNYNYNLYSFEPSKKTFSTLNENLNDSHIQLFNYGFSDIECYGTLFSNQELSGLASLYERKMTHFNIDFSKSEKIKLTTLDIFCLENAINKIDFLKLDVEGNELKVLKGAKNMLSKGGIKAIQFEMGGANIDSKTFFQEFWYLLSSNYNIYRILTNGLFEIKEYEENLEVFKTINFLAINKQNGVSDLLP